VDDGDESCCDHYGVSDPSPGGVRLSKVKRPGGLFWFDLRFVGRNDHGIWLSGPIGSPWGAPHDAGRLPVDVAVLLSPGRPWVAWWVDDPADPRLEIDVCLPPERTASGWRYVDLELDPVRHEADGRVEIEDWDEYQEWVDAGWMSNPQAHLARQTAEQLAESLSRPAEAWQEVGWHFLGVPLPRR